MSLDLRRRVTRSLAAFGKFCKRSIRSLSRGFVSRFANRVNEELHHSSRVTISATHDGVLYNLFRGKSRPIGF